ncbi:MAG TPA: amidohydrolase [Anaerolineae bacterium]|nr:amidohydrolase [Anaerolineae bacterium]
MADQLLVNGRIYTMDAGCPRASALVVAGERILAVGDDPAALRPLLAPGAHVLDLGGRCVIPGLTDSHIHFAWYAQTLGLLDLATAATLDQVLDLVAQRARLTRPGEWVLGQGWDQERWPERRFPTAADLDRVAPAHPVMLRAKSGHALVANSPALHKAGITAQTPDPPGGRIGRDATGSPDGLLFEDSAMELVAGLVPSPGPGEAAGLLRQAFPSAWRVGLTAIHDMDGSSAFAAYQYLHARGELGLRVVKYLPASALDCALEIGLRAGLGDDWLRVGGLKAFADGALGPRTAAMLAPYAGEPDNLGILTIDEEALHTLVRKAAAGGLSLAIHAIGDRANRLVLDALSPPSLPSLPSPPSPPFPPSPPLRHRIEHVQLLHPADVPRLAALGVVASMQPLHATQDCEMADRYWGERCATAYAWRSLLQAGTLLAFGSDCPVEDLNPFLGIHAAVTRRRMDGSGLSGPEGWIPQQRLTVEEALHAYTLGAARAAGLEDRLGSLAPGKLADLVVLDRDIFACDPMEIAQTQVVATMLGGRFVYGEV